MMKVSLIGRGQMVEVISVEKVDKCKAMVLFKAVNHLNEQNSCSHIGGKVEEVMGHLRCHYNYHHFQEHEHDQNDHCDDG